MSECKNCNVEIESDKEYCILHEIEKEISDFDL